jgi:hypothetical protein
MRKNLVTPMQHVECETCGEVFLHMDAWEYVKVSRCYNNRGRQPPVPEWRLMRTTQEFVEGANQTVLAAKGFYDKFFCKAVLHWCDNPEHTIIVSVPLGDNGATQRFDMTRDFKEALASLGPKYIIAERGLMLAAYDEGSII